MSSTVTVDAAGRIVIPKPVRDQLGLDAGDTLALESDGDSLTLRPVRASHRLHKKQGVWVFRGGRTITTEMTNKLLDRMRAERGRLQEEPEER